MGILLQIRAQSTGMTQEKEAAIGDNNRWEEPGNSRHHKGGRG